MAECKHHLNCVRGVDECGIYTEAYLKERANYELRKEVSSPKHPEYVSFAERIAGGMVSKPKHPEYVSFAERIAGRMVSRPKHPEYASYAARLASFDRWPKLTMSQTKETLATAGFYYTGSGVQTLCYHCGGGLSYWEPEDDPWIKHAKWFAYCPYVILSKGMEFVSSIASRTDIGAENLLPAIELASSKGQSVQGDEPFNKDAISCKICYNREVQIVFMPCGHLLACAECAKNLKICGVCRKPVESTVQAYIP